MNQKQRTETVEKVGNSTEAVGPSMVRNIFTIIVRILLPKVFMFSAHASRRLLSTPIPKVPWFHLVRRAESHRWNTRHCFRVPRSYDYLTYFQKALNIFDAVKQFNIFWAVSGAHWIMLHGNKKKGLLRLLVMKRLAEMLFDEQVAIWITWWFLDCITWWILCLQCKIMEVVPQWNIDLPK